MSFRHEYKHAINYCDYLTLRTRLRTVMRQDSHAEGGRYHIRSLYFDDYRDEALREKINGINKREKYRIRFYNMDDSYVCLEKKCKTNGLTEKFGIPITRVEAEKIIGGDTAWMADDSRTLVQELYANMKGRLLRPKTIVDYIREPYIYPIGNVRVTFDSDIRTGLSSTRIFSPDTQTVPVGDGIILEVKYDAFLPNVIRDILQLDSRSASAYSKYAECRKFG
ncbi:MAG: polyphosphate polymerase domain-containing protein [Oscillospiraceae bacterium]